MPDDADIQCALGKMQQSIEDIRTDISEIKDEQRKVAEFITTQKTGMWLLGSITAAIGALIIGFHEEVTKLFGFKLPN